MNKLDIKLGGHHFTADDLLFLQTCLSDTIKAFAQMFEDSALILFGVEFSIAGPTLNWTAGWVYINGEVCKVDAGSATLASNNTMVIVQTYDPEGQQTYEDLNLEDTYVIRKATISGTGGGANLYTNLKRVKLGAVGDWNSLSSYYAGSWGPQSGGVVPGYRKNGIKEVVMKGAIEINNWASPADAVAFTLPVGFRPSELTSVPVCATVNTNFTVLMVDISVGGDVVPQGLSTNDDVVLFLDGIRFQG